MDFGNLAFHTAATRGVSEEFLFAHGADSSDSKLLALLSEYQIVNPALVAYIAIPFTFDELLAWQRSIPKAQREFEPERISGIPVDIDVLAGVAIREEFGAGHVPIDGRWHPTSRYRLLLTKVHRFGSHDTLEALARQTQRKS
ncbi:MAG: hypothetical protein HY675_12840 [Chloroflexi bacterium]|nr:hypothetical protein [Chloroflexota bacterium]